MYLYHMYNILFWVDDICLVYWLLDNDFSSLQSYEQWSSRTASGGCIRADINTVQENLWCEEIVRSLPLHLVWCLATCCPYFMFLCILSFQVKKSCLDKTGLKHISRWRVVQVVSDHWQGDNLIQFRTFLHWFQLMTRKESHFKSKTFGATRAWQGFWVDQNEWGSTGKSAFKSM